MSKTVAVFAASPEVFRDRIFDIVGYGALWQRMCNEVWTRDVHYHYIRSERDLRGWTFDAVMLLDGYHKTWDTVKDYIPYSMRG